MKLAPFPVLLRLSALVVSRVSFHWVMRTRSAALISSHPCLCFLFKAPPHVSPSHVVINPDTALSFYLSLTLSFSLQLFGSFNPLWICLFSFQFFPHPAHLLTGFRMLCVCHHLTFHENHQNIWTWMRDFFCVCIAWGISQLWNHMFDSPSSPLPGSVWQLLSVVLVMWSWGSWLLSHWIGLGLFVLLQVP